MSRNRVKHSQSLHWMGVIKWILIASLLAGLGLCYMLCKNQNLHLAEQKQRMQGQLDAITLRNEDLEADVQHMKSSNLLRRQLALMHSALVRLDDPRMTIVRFDQNTRARLAHDSDMPTLKLGINPTFEASTPVPASKAVR